MLGDVGDTSKEKFIIGKFINKKQAMTDFLNSPLPILIPHWRNLQSEKYGPQILWIRKKGFFKNNFINYLEIKFVK